VTDNELVTSIINPSHEIDSHYKKQLVTSRPGGHSRMASYADIMTVQELADLVALMREINRIALDRKKGG
jgi:hypothetical protein